MTHPSPRVHSPAVPTWDPWSTLFTAGLVLLGLGLLIQPLGDPDVFIHLRDGRYWLEHGLRVGTEPFSYTAADKPFETAEWFFRIGLYWLYTLGGYNLLIAVKSLAMAAALFLLGKLVYRAWPNLGWTALLLLAAALAPNTRIFPERPYVFTYLFLPLIMLWLEDYRSASAADEPKARARLWLAAPLTVVWANLHPGFMVVFGFLGAYWLNEVLHFWRTRDALARRRAVWLAAISAAVFIAGGINSMGFTLYTFSLDILRSNAFMSFITEWAPPRPDREPLFFSLVALAWLAQVFNWKRARIYELLPMLAFSYMAMKSYRNMPLFLIAALPVLARNLRELAGRLPALTRPISPGKRRAGLIAGTILSLALLAGASSIGFAFNFGLLPGFYPSGALAWMERHPLRGRLFTHDIWGGYTGWMTQGRTKIFMDGRLPTFGEKLYADYRKMVWGDPSDCLRLLDRYEIQGVLVSPKNEIKLYQELWRSGHWALMYWDDVSLLYVRRDGPNREWVKAGEYRALDPKRSPFFNPAEPALALEETGRAVQAAPGSYLPYFLRGELLMQNNRPDEAAAAFKETLRLAPRHNGAHYSLGVIAAGRGDLIGAETHFRTALSREQPGEMFAKTSFLLAQTIKGRPEKRAEARRLAQKAVAILPAWEPARQLLRELEGPWMP